MFVSPNGTQLELIDHATIGAVYNIPNPCNNRPTSVDAGRGTLFQSSDGTVQFMADSTVLDNTAPGIGEADARVNGTLRFPNGVSYRIDNSTVTRIEDRNGNQITFQYGSQIEFITWYLWVAAPTQITDSLGRTTILNYNDSSCSGCITITYPGSNGSTHSIQIVQAHLSAGLLRSGAVETTDQLFPGTGQPTSYNFDPILASYIQLPDGSRYTFRYNTFGELARVTLPTGGAVEYDFGDGHNGQNSGFEGVTTDNNPVMIYRRLQERREYADGSNLSSRTHYTVGSTGSATTEQTTYLWAANSAYAAPTINLVNADLSAKRA